MGNLKAAAGKVDLAPPTGTWLTGYGNRTQGSTGTHDPIMARAVVVSDGDRAVAVVSCEVVGWSPGDGGGMRLSIAAATDIEWSDILINCTHTHSGPASMPLRGSMGVIDREWLKDAQQKVVDLVASLPARLVPVRMAYGVAEVGGIAFNRQDADGPLNEMLQTVVLEAETDEVVATLSCYNCHAVVLGPTNLQFSGDFPGAFSRQMEERTGGVCLYLQGCCGDVDPAINREAWGTGTFDDCEAIGNRLADAATQSVVDVPRLDEASLGAGFAIAEFRLNPPPDDLDAVAEEFLRQYETAPSEEAKITAKAMIEWTGELQALLAGGGVAPVYATVSALTLGSVALVGLPFETYTDIGRRIRENPWSRHTMVLGYTNGLFGYCATDEARQKGGYGPDSSHRWFPTLPTPLPMGADDILVAAAQEALAGCR